MELAEAIKIVERLSAGDDAHARTVFSEMDQDALRTALDASRKVTRYALAMIFPGGASSQSLSRREVK